MTEYKMDLGGALAVAINGLTELLFDATHNNLKRETAIAKMFERPETLEEAHEQLLEIGKVYHKWMDDIERLVVLMTGKTLVDIKKAIQSEWELVETDNSQEENQTLYENLVKQLPKSA